MDGTLLNSQHRLSDRTEKALRAAMDKGIQIVLATGKTFRSAADIIRQLNLTTPGIYSQGTMICDPDGSIRHQQTLPPALTRQVVTFAEDRGFTIAAYSGARILVRRRDRAFEELITAHDDPAPEVIGPLQNVMDSLPINKLTAFNDGDARAITALRWQLGMQLNGSARLVQAGIPHMMEVLPPGASKGAMLRLLLKDLGIPPEAVLAAGDAENDIEMVQLCGLGVAVANAGQALKDVADYIAPSNNEDGVAEAIERFVLNAVAAPETTTG